ncbi:transcriptional regulator [Sinomonas sp. P47F7]|uniref:transcriptional regulator n=1 Tax=Sinomonas sp. P47F7 TaxID=3410987 RepID=UPI003BF6184F
MKDKTVRAWKWYSVASVLVWVGALAIGAIAFVTASEAARASAQDGTFLQQFLGAPLFEGFRLAGKFGVRPQWGLMLLVVVPFSATAALTALQVRRFVRGNRA